VLQAGDITLRDVFLLQQRPNTGITIDTLLKVIHDEAEQQLVELVINAIGLDPEWQQRLQKKYHVD
jgi:MOSC domain-containing protein YiiM